MKKIATISLIAMITVAIMTATAGAGSWHARHYRRYHHYHPHTRFYVGVYLPLPAPPPPPMVVYGPAPAYVPGAIDTDIEPEEAQIFLDGKYVGTADDFDGWPTYLYLRPGTYHLEAYLSGYEPLSIEVEVRAGQRLRLNQKLIPAGRHQPWEGERGVEQGESDAYEGDSEEWREPPEYQTRREGDDRRPPARNEEFSGDF